MAWQNVYVEIEATVAVQMEKSDNGLDGPHYREWAEPDPNTYDIESLHMFGRAWTPRQLVEKFGKQGADALMDLIFDQTDKDAWQGDDE